MKKLFSLTAIVLVLVFMSGCQQEPVYNVQHNISVKDKQLEDIYSAIKNGAEFANWDVERTSKNELIATTYIRVHTAKVKISFDESSYSIKLFRAINIKNSPENGTIHANYNKWIKVLEKEIELQLSKLKT